MNTEYSVYCKRRTYEIHTVHTVHTVPTYCITAPKLFIEAPKAAFASLHVYSTVARLARFGGGG